jgi:hypothetical protein
MSMEVGESPGDRKTLYVGHTMSSPWGVYGVEERAGVSVSVMGFSVEAAAALLAGAAAVSLGTSAVVTWSHPQPSEDATLHPQH